MLCLPLACCSYEKWKQKNKVDERDEDEDNQGGREQYRGKHRRGHGEYLNKQQSLHRPPLLSLRPPSAVLHPPMAVSVPQPPRSPPPRAKCARS